EGDVFLGLTVPQSRSIAKGYVHLPLHDIKELLYSSIHEDRLIALIILVAQYKKGSEVEKKKRFDFYQTNLQQVNNWDLVDLSAEYLIGDYLYHFQNGSQILQKLAKSKRLWDRRIAIMSTFAFIKHGKSDVTFKIAEILLYDREDLIHKAVGWMLRE